MRACASGLSLLGYGISTPIRRVRSGCCARAPNGHVTAPPINVMNSRRLIASPKSQEAHRSGSELGGESPTDVRFGSKADMCSARGHVRFAPESDQNSGHRGFPLRAGHLPCKVQTSTAIERASSTSIPLSGEKHGPNSCTGNFIGRGCDRLNQFFRGAPGGGGQLSPCCQGAVKVGAPHMGIRAKLLKQWWKLHGPARHSGMPFSLTTSVFL